MSERNDRYQESGIRRFSKFAAGLMILSLFYLIIASGLTPPGICGEVLRHNRAYEIDASPLFYTEVENMAELEKGLMLLKDKEIQSIE